MSRFVLAAVLMTVAVAGPVLGAKKQRDWQTGKVLDTDQARVYLGTTGSTNTNGRVYTQSDSIGGASGNVLGAQHNSS